ncbi:MAG TPA: MerR family transcriptional regulator [Thermomicrobiales bacterium]|nr:MerR family transcriptional regulator [Thermomicrobiales bacterium]
MSHGVTGARYQAQEFAARTGVTVRALHHYDRLGLLRPSARSAAGYRLYGEHDVARLQQILTLKFLGLPLRQIKDLLGPAPGDLAATLRLQREAIAERRRRLDLALEAIGEAERRLAAGADLDWDGLKVITEAITMQRDWDQLDWSWTQNYSTEGQRRKLAARNVPPDVVKQGERDWAVLIAEVEAATAAREDPAGAHARALADRWAGLVQGFTGGDPEIAANLKQMYADMDNWPTTWRPCSQEAWAFMGEALAARANDE